MTATTTPVYQPLYKQIKALLVSRLANHEWPPGAALPSEIALPQAYNVSQGTVRKALNVLEEERVVERRQGRGTFIARHSRQRSLFQFFHLRSDHNTSELPDSRVVSCRSAKANKAETAMLELDDGATVTRIQRVRDLGGTPVIYETVSVPAALFPGLLDRARVNVPNTLYEYYESEYNVVVTHASEKLRAVSASATHARYLNVERGTPLLSVERAALDISHRPIEWRRSYCDTAHHFYFNELD